jgi:ferredoxin-NADP reductase/fatty acid desaturase
MSIVSNNLKVREVINQVVNDPKYKSVSAVPLISIYQIGLLLFIFLLTFGGIYLASIGTSLWVLYPFMIFGIYTSFTILHDATHRAVSSNKFFNDFLGTVAGNLQFPFVSTTFYRYFHLAHHRYVGDKDLDPDEAMVAIPTKYFPIGYLSLFVYEYFIFRWLFTKVWHRTPTKLKIIISTSLVLNIVFNVGMLLSPYGYEFLFWFLIPNRIGTALTTYFFAHLPHPEGMQWDSFPFQSAYTIKGNKLVLSALWGQSHHAMHHFLPHVPWYKYHKIWDLANGIFQKQNIPVREIISRPDTHFKETILRKGVVDNGKNTLSAKVASIVNVASDIKSFVLEPLDEKGFPMFTAGSHININLPSGKVRSYSLVNPSYEKNRYQIAVKLEQNGKGGSKEIHDKITKGSVIEISEPKNNFVLYENVQKYILVSGGIGITPLLSMAHKLVELDKHFEFHICARTEAYIPFQYELQNWTFAPNTEIHLDKEGRSSIDLANILAKPERNTLLYVCGPTGFNKWIKESACKHGWKKDQIKEEVFSNITSTSTESKAFEVVLNKKGKSITVDKDITILDALLMNNVKVDYSCLQGTCGTCITNVIEGEIDHRDAVLSEEEKIACDKICLCVSRAKNNKIVLDL